MPRAGSTTTTTGEPTTTNTVDLSTVRLDRGGLPPLVNVQSARVVKVRSARTDVRHLAANELRAAFGVVPQETVLFSGTILANLMAGNPAASFEQVAQACRMAGIHDVVEALPQGYQTGVGERGVGLSGGQKQRLAIARALLKGPKVLIFDEATSALDGETAESFARTINALKGKVTMLFMTHALPKALKVDGVVQLTKEGAQRLNVVPQSAAPAGGAAQGSQESQA